VRILRHDSRSADVAGLRRLGAARTSTPGVRRKVTAILRAVEREGDRAVVRYARRFDGARFGAKALKATPREVRSLAQRASRALRTALADMAARIEAYHRRQLVDGFRVETDDGSILEEVVRPLERVALYVPGGAGAYPSSVLMNAIPARVAGVPRIQVMTEREILNTFQITQSMATWWTTSCC